MKKAGKKFYLHLSIVILFVIAAAAGWITLFIVINLLYAIFWAVKIVVQGVRGTENKVRRIVETILLALGAAWLVPFMLIPSWVVGVTYSQRHPEIKENVPELAFFNVVLKNASKFETYNFWAVEGFLSENELLELAADRNWQLQKITDMIIVSDTAKNLIGQHRSASYEQSQPVIKAGYFCSTYRNSDSGISCFWDKENNKFYFYSSKR